MAARARSIGGLRVVDIRDALAALAVRLTETRDATRSTMGDITLTDVQGETVQRAEAALAQFNGVVLGDDTGAGKTYIALALARRYARRLILAPAGLRTTWADAQQRAETPCAFCSYEQLSRGRVPDGDFDVIIADEAHHLRTRGTLRYAAAQRLCAGPAVILATATPVHNRLDERDALLALVLGADARDLDEAGRAALIVRSAGPPREVPAVHTHPPVTIPDVPPVVGSILALPPPLPPREAGSADALWRLSLLRAWSSSAAALDAMLRRAELAAAALIDAWRAGHAPSRRELTAWSIDGDGQLAFAEFAAPIAVCPAAGIALAEHHRAAVRALRAAVRDGPDVDAARVTAVLALRAQNPTTPMLVCSQYAATIDRLWSTLRHTPQVAALTARGGRIASGPLSRDAILRRFAPVAQGAAPPVPRERITLLLATDLVSEGLNLQDAGMLVHIDTPWTPARLAQRVGRLARPGSPHPSVQVHSLAPPRATAALLALERRLAEKGHAAADAQRPADARREIEVMLRAWQRAPALVDGADTPVLAALLATCDGWIVCLDSTAPRLVVAIDGAPPSSDPVAVASALREVRDRLAGPAAPRARLPTDAAQRLREITDWLRHDRARHLAVTHRPHAARRHRRALNAAVLALAAAPAHEQILRATESSALYASLTTARHHHSIAPSAASVIILLSRDG